MPHFQGQAGFYVVHRTLNSEMEVICYQHMPCWFEQEDHIQNMNKTISSQTAAETRSHQIMARSHRKHNKSKTNKQANNKKKKTNKLKMKNLHSSMGEKNLETSRC